jgi:DNA-binding GntR family transcriptional regulator
MNETAEVADARGGHHDFSTLLGEKRIDRRAPIWAQVHALLRDAIARMRLLPGRNLSEQEISLALGVSRTPVREAFIRLSEEGLVDIYPQYGTFVAPIRTAAVLEAQFIRDSLECSIVRRVAERPDDALITEVQDLIAGQLKAVEAGDQRRFYDLDERMHEAFSVACNRQGVWRFIQSAKVHVDRVRHVILPRDLRFRSLVDEHVAILAGIMEGSPAAAAAAMHEHLDGVLRGLPDAQEAYPEYFEQKDARQRPPRQDRST